MTAYWAALSVKQCTSGYFPILDSWSDSGNPAVLQAAPGTEYSAPERSPSAGLYLRSFPLPVRLPDHIRSPGND